MEEAALSDEKRIRLALETLGYENVQIPLSVLRKLYPLCRNAGFAITVTLVRRETDWVMVTAEAGDKTKEHYALAVDYGSTTIVMELVDMNFGSVIDRVSAVNGQAVYGTNILTRITFAKEDPANKARLQKATVRTFDSLLAQLTENTGIDASGCPVMILSGNTTMIHFLLQLDAWKVFASPYAPVVSDPGFFWGRELDMAFEGLVYIIPAASNYIGGDSISGLLKLDVHKQEDVCLFFDIGTNGELVIGNRDWILAGAGAAGPALEGYISRFGMRAGDGEYVAVYALAEESASGAPLYFSQTDIMQYLDTKAAADTMVECLLESAGVTVDEISRCYLSGAFPAHSDLESAVTIGIFPDLPREKYSVIANASLEGARILLHNRSKLWEAKNIAENMYCVRFASVPDFLVRMQAAKFIPHTEISRYPSIEKRLNHK